MVRSLQAVKEKITEVFFETFNAPGLYFESTAVLALYASGRSTGVVIEVNDSGMTAVRTRLEHVGWD